MNPTILVFVALVFSHFVFGNVFTIYLWLLGLSLWMLFHVRHKSSIHERLDEIDMRDMEYHDYYEKKVLEIGEEVQELKKKSEVDSAKE
jgi:hypothetical protein